MGIQVWIDGVKTDRVFSGPFFAIRIGTGLGNTIIIADKTPGVHTHHCTIVHTGSTYRLEMLPSHLVFVDGERGECGQQLFLHNTRSCTLSIGGAAPAARNRPGGKRFAPPPQIRLERVGDDTSTPAPRHDHTGPATNIDIGKFMRVSVRNIVTYGSIAFVLAAVAIGLSAYFSNAADAALAKRLDETAKLTDLPPGAEVAGRARDAVFQVGLVETCPEAAGGDFSSCDFYPAGTAWAWADGTQRRLVTNVHVVQSVNNCSLSTSAEARDKCVAPLGSCPAVRYFAGNEDARQALVQPIASCTERTGVLARIHADHDAFERWTQRASAGTLPNVYDIAVIDWPAAVTWKGQGLKLATDAGSLEAGRGVGMFGFPSEGGLRTDWSAANALFRPGSIGRTQDPFGLPSAEEYLVTISGPEVIGGESGGPVINAKGDVVAMTFANFSQPGDAQLGRITYGARMKALSARLLTENDRFIPINAPASLKTSEERLKLWRLGLAGMSDGRKKTVVAKFRGETCPDGYVPRERSVLKKTVKASEPTKFRVAAASPTGVIDGWSYSEDLELSGRPSATSRIIVMAASIGQPRQVMISYRRGEYSRHESSDPTLTFASVPDTFQFPPEQMTRKAALMLFTPDDIGKDASFDLEVLQVVCVPGESP